MKVRLFSPCSKEFEGKDEPNPAIGKAKQVHGMLAWLSGGFEVCKELFSARWTERMEAFLPKSLYRRYLPVQLGGLQVPAFHLDSEKVREALDQVPPTLRKAISLVLSDEASPVLRRAVRGFSTNARVRGVDERAIEEQIRSTLSMSFLTESKTGEEIRQDQKISEADWENYKFNDKKRVARQSGYLTIDDALSYIDRPYTFRNMFFPEVSLKHGINPYTTKSYEAIPWPKRESKHIENLDLLFEETGVQEPLDEDSWNTISDRLASHIATNEPIDIPRHDIYVPERVVVTKDLCTLRTPVCGF
jgi:hypothetical protein